MTFPSTYLCPKHNPVTSSQQEPQPDGSEIFRLFCAAVLPQHLPRASINFPVLVPCVLLCLSIYLIYASLLRLESSKTMQYLFIIIFRNDSVGPPAGSGAFSRRKLPSGLLLVLPNPRKRKETLSEAFFETTFFFGKDVVKMPFWGEGSAWEKEGQVLVIECLWSVWKMPLQASHSCWWASLAKT